jgi:hypothetical protein
MHLFLCCSAINTTFVHPSHQLEVVGFMCHSNLFEFAGFRIMIDGYFMELDSGLFVYLLSFELKAS